MTRRPFLIRFFPLILFLFTLLLHLWKINQDLPFIYNVDEPHHLNVAAHFSTGDLNPHDFKYPTLWPYLVATGLGALFVAAKFLGIVATSHDFAVLFFQNPTPFYLTFRVLGALFISLAPVLLFYAGRRTRSFAFAAAVGGLCSLSPMIVSYGHDATHYNLLFFLLAVVVYWFERLAHESTRSAYFWSGVSLGLAATTYYLAAPLGLALLALHLLVPKEKRTISNLTVALAAAAAAFFLGSPYLFLDFKSFHQTLISLNQIQKPESVQPDFIGNGVLVLKNAVQFIDVWGWGALLAAIGIFTSKTRRRKELLAWILPLLVFSLYLAHAHFGALPRYGICIQFPLFILAAEGFQNLWEKWKDSLLPKILMVVIVFGPPLITALSQAKATGLPDTRTLARVWVEKNIPSGEKILEYGQYHSIPLDMNLIQLERLKQQAQQINHPRQSYYALLIDGYKGGGYDVSYLRRSLFETQDLPERAEHSFQGLPMLDADELGLEGIRKEGIRYVVVEDSMRTTRKDFPWFQELEQMGTPVYRLDPQAGLIKGPAIIVYQLPPLKNR